MMSREKGDGVTMLTSDMEAAERRVVKLIEAGERYLKNRPFPFEQPTLAGVPFPRVAIISLPRNSGSNMYERYLAMDKSPERTEIVPMKGVP